MKRVAIVILAIGVVGFFGYRMIKPKPSGKVISIQGEFKLPSLDTIPKGDNK